MLELYKCTKFLIFKTWIFKPKQSLLQHYLNKLPSAYFIFSKQIRPILIEKSVKQLSDVLSRLTE